jgi:hypothetical protein
MKKRDQDVENRLKCLKSDELSELLDFIIPNRNRGEADELSGHNLAPNPAQHPN